MLRAAMAMFAAGSSAAFAAVMVHAARAVESVVGMVVVMGMHGEFLD
jgi:hypothetical protein